jgi:hypothetical protein
MRALECSLVEIVNEMFSSTVWLICEYLGLEDIFSVVFY